MAVSWHERGSLGTWPTSPVHSASHWPVPARSDQAAPLSASFSRFPGNARSSPDGSGSVGSVWESSSWLGMVLSWSNSS